MARNRMQPEADPEPNLGDRGREQEAERAQEERVHSDEEDGLYQHDSAEDPFLLPQERMETVSEPAITDSTITGNAENPRSPTATTSRSTPAQERATEAAAKLTRRLYLSHFLSTWSSRMFEFGAVLFLVSVFPETLLYTSVYALVRSLAVALLSSWLGSWIDKLDRLTTLRRSIVWQRIPVAVSCLCFILLFWAQKDDEDGAGSPLVPYLFTVVVALACVEKLASVANTVSVERDWVVIIAESLQIPRQDLNASMRRIDLFCKLFAPVFISLVDSFSTKLAIWTVFVLNASWVVIEYVAIAQVYNAVPELARRDPPASSSGQDAGGNGEQLAQGSNAIVRYIRNMAVPWRDYITSPVFLASFALSLLYLTVLSFAPQMITYLLHTGFSPLQVSCMRIGAVISELAGTWAAPMAMHRIGPVRAGLWFINWQFGCLAAAAAGFIFFDDSSSNSRLVAVSLIIGVALSRVGLWGFDLSVQYLVQEGTTTATRARFSSTEMALQNIFELVSFMITIVFPRPEQFKYPVLISYGAIGIASISYAAYVRKERGHLVHLSKLCFGRDGDDKMVFFSGLGRSGRRNDGYQHLV